MDHAWAVRVVWCTPRLEMVFCSILLVEQRLLLVWVTFCQRSKDTIGETNTSPPSWRTVLFLGSICSYKSLKTTTINKCFSASSTKKMKVNDTTLKQVDRFLKILRMNLCVLPREGHWRQRQTFSGKIGLKGKQFPTKVSQNCNLCPLLAQGHFCYMNQNALVNYCCP